MLFEKMKFPSDETFKLIFDHIRNFLICCTVTGLGMYAYKQEIGSGDLFKLTAFKAAAFLGVALLFFNLFHILNKTRTKKYRALLVLSITIFYLGIVTQLFQAAWMHYIV